MLSKPKQSSVPYYTPDKWQCLILGNFDYAVIRYGDQKELGITDLPEVIQDIEVFSQKIQQYNFDEDTEITVRKNLDFAKTKKLFLSLQNKIAENSRSNQKTLTMMYYGGHGMMSDNQS